ncbi:MAG: GNAT family N-acetyltransferase [Gammaproteobacteria bacterium]|nr:GNAT family N-acetyltransferase [Gammaproteobacteria bacterium]
MATFLETKRCVLTLPKDADLNDLIALRTDPEVMKYIGNGAIQTKDQVSAFLANFRPYFEKHGLTFYSAFLKETEEFIGQAGLFHLGFDDSQSEIEVAYRLHKKFWGQGLATELVTVLIQWGFNHLAIQKIIAIVHPENEASRRVMEKSGMHYQGIISYKDQQLPCYEAVKSTIELSALRLVPASIDDCSVMQNMAAYYAYDVSEYMKWKQENDGTANIGIDFSKYFQKDNTFPFMIKYHDELAGFVIVDDQVSDPSNDFSIAQFFILRKFTGCGIGRHIAFQCFDTFHGKWEVFVMPGNEGAYRFWRKIIRFYTRQQCKEYTRVVNNFKRNIFEFKSIS